MRIAQDKLLHALAGAALAAVVAPVAGVWVALEAVALVAVAKEGADQLANHRAARAGLPAPHGVELADVLATLAGALAALAAQAGLRHLWPHFVSAGAAVLGAFNA